jgi:hypothetical protein
MQAITLKKIENKGSQMGANKKKYIYIYVVAQLVSIMSTQQ